ncbi:MAG TPA: type II toxin-antitoxin system RelE/ParE family toxin [Thermomicrobiales bacterium]|jgi:mRNA interferase RelE/StbE
MAYDIEWLRSASKAFDRLPPAVRQRLERAITALADNPRPSGVRSVVTGAGELRLRAGDSRVIDEVDDSARTVLIVKVAHRSEAYR